MTFEPLKNNEGADVYPSSAALFVDKPGVVFDDTQYNDLKNPPPTSEPATTQSADPVNPEPVIPAATEPISTSEPVTPPSIDYDAILKERTGGKVEKWDDLMAKLDQPDLTFGNEKSRKLFDYLREGKQDEVFDLLQKERLLINAETMSDSDKVKLKIQLDNPDWNIDDVEDEYQDRFGIRVDKDEVTDEVYAREQRKAERKLASEVKVAKEYFDSLKGALELPDLTKPATADPRLAQYESQLTEIQNINDRFMSAVDSQATALGSIDLSVNDKDVQFTHSFEIPEADKPALIAAAKDYWNEFNRMYAKDGSYNATQLMQDLYILKNLPGIIKSAVAKSANEKHIGVVRNIANVSDTPVSTAPVDIQAAAARAEKARFILG